MIDEETTEQDQAETERLAQLGADLDDETTAAAGADEESKPEGEPHRRTRRPGPGHTAGWYMVIASTAGEKVGFEEVGWYKASDDDQAKRHCVDDAKRGHLPPIKEALEGDGIWLRGVPARSWPATKRTGYDQPPPRLRIG